jgi:hypothetical protein
VAEEDWDEPRLLQVTPEAPPREGTLDRLIAMAAESQKRLPQVADHGEMLVDREELEPGDTRHFAQSGGRVREVLETAEAHDEIEAGILEWQLLGTRLDEVNGAVRARALERSRREIDSDDVGIERLEPAFAAADVECAKAFCQLGDDLVGPVVHVESTRAVQAVVEFSRPS